MTPPERFGTLPDGSPVDRVRLSAGAIEAQIINWGATLQDLRVGGRRVVLGSDRLEDYLGPLAYAGATVGRFANRIGGARFDLDGQTWHTDPNFRDHHTLHGGAGGTGNRLWRFEEMAEDRVTLTLDLPHGDMGFPGDLTVRCTYRLIPPGTLDVVIEAVTSQATPCSFAHHSYFVLDDSGEITSHLLQVAAEEYLPVDDDLIPTGEIATVAGTKFDYRQPRMIGTRGYDHNFCLARAAGPLRFAARMASAVTGLAMIVETTAPGLQVYDGAHLGGAPGYGGTPLRSRAGLALEAQHWPDSPNRPEFPDPILRPGGRYRSETRYSFLSA